MNPLTLVKRTQQINLKEASLGISEEASWHSKFKDSAYIFVGGIPFDLTEGDLLAVFAQYGEIVDVNLVRDKATGKSRGFAFLAYEDQRSTILAVDNLNGAKVLGRVVRVDHVANYRKKEEAEEDPEEEKRKREARGVCYAFQRGECNRGATCKFSHDEQRNANTGWGSKDADSRWVKAKDFPMDSLRDQSKIRGETKHKSLGKDESSRVEDGDNYKVRSKDYGTYGRDLDQQVKERSPDSRDKESRQKDNRDGGASGRQFTGERTETHSGIKEGERHRRHYRDSSSYVSREDVRTEPNSGIKEGERHRRRDRDSSSYVRREDAREHKRRSHR